MDCLFGSGLSVRGLGFVVVVLRLAVQKNVPDPTSCRDAHQVLSVTIWTCRDFITDSAFWHAFSHNPTTFAMDPKVVGSVTGSAPVEHLHN